jgi:hypothetical protein
VYYSENAKSRTKFLFIRELSIDQFFSNNEFEKIIVSPVSIQHRQSVQGSRIHNFIFLSDREKHQFSEDCGLKAWQSRKFTT